MDKNINTLDCLLISPPVHHKDSENIWKAIDSNFPPLGLADIAGYIREKGATVKILDCNLESPSVETFGEFFEKNYVSNFTSIKVIGMTTMTCNIKKAYEVADICKKHYPNAIIVFGGVHATFMTKEVIDNEHVDVVVIGEGEKTLHELVSGKEFGQIKGIAYKKNANGKVEIIINPPRERFNNLDILPMPAYDLLPVLKYRPAKGSYKRLPAMSMMTSRGCPGRCTFCSKTLGNLLVFKSAEKVYEEIKYLSNNYGIRQILFYDDTFTVNRKNVLRLCDLIINDRLDISWTCFARVDFIDYDMLKKMKKAGCHQIMYGVENIDEKVLANINKKINIGQIINAVKWTKMAGIECRLAFMVGNPGDNNEIIKKNLNFAKKLSPDIIIVNITTPFPGTEMFYWAKEKGLILTYDWDDYTLAKPVMKLENMSPEEIKNLYRIMYRGFYLRPSYIMGRIFKIRSFTEFMNIFDGIKVLFSFFGRKR